MPVDPTEPENVQNDENGEAEAAELSVETPEADAAEQHTDLRPDRDDPLTRLHPDTASEADLVEQARVVTLDEDDYP